MNESRIPSSCPMTIVPIASRNLEKRVATQPASLESSWFMNQAGTGFQSAHCAHQFGFGRRRFVAHDPAPSFVGVPERDLVAVRVRHDGPAVVASSLRRVTTFHVRTVAGVWRPPWTRAVFILEAATPCGYRK